MFQRELMEQKLLSYGRRTVYECAFNPERHSSIHCSSIHFTAKP